MGFWLLAVTLVIYGFVAFDYWTRGDYPHAWAFVCYAGANMGFMAHLKGMGG